MRHNIHAKKLGRTTAHRTAMFRNQLASLVQHQKIRTTLSKAKALRPVAEKMITQGREDTVHSRRQVRRWLPNRSDVKRLFDTISPRFLNRPGGYTRIIKLGPRRGDGAEMAILELVEKSDD